MPVAIPTPPSTEPISDGRFPHGEVVTVVNRTVAGQDAEGNDVYTASSQDYIGAFDPAIGFESTNLEDQVQTQPGVFLPYVAVVTSYSVIVARGDHYEVDGSPSYWRNPFTGTEAGCQVPLKRVTG